MLNIKYEDHRPFFRRSPLQSRALLLSYQHTQLWESIMMVQIRYFYMMTRFY